MRLQQTVRAFASAALSGIPVLAVDADTGAKSAATCAAGAGDADGSGHK